MPWMKSWILKSSQEPIRWKMEAVILLRLLISVKMSLLSLQILVQQQLRTRLLIQ